MKDTFSEGKKKGGEKKLVFFFKEELKEFSKKKMRARKLKFSLTLYKIKR